MKNNNENNLIEVIEQKSKQLMEFLSEYKNRINTIENLKVAEKISKEITEEISKVLINETELYNTILSIFI